MRKFAAMFVLAMSGSICSAAARTETWPAWAIGFLAFWIVWGVGAWLFDAEIEAAREKRDA